MIQWCGPGSIAQRRAAAADGSVLRFTLNSGDEASVPIVAKYKHLGSVFALHAISPALADRRSLLVSDLQQYRRIFHNPAVPLLRKSHIARALVLSRFIFTLGHGQSFLPPSP